jgi:uncharacterized membrane protein
MRREPTETLLNPMRMTKAMRMAKTLVVLAMVLALAAGANAAYYYRCAGVFNTACAVNGVMYHPPCTITGQYSGYGPGYYPEYYGGYGTAYPQFTFVQPMPEYPGFVTRTAYVPPYIPPWDP